MTHNSKYSTRVCGTRLRQAFDRLSNVLGRSIVDLLVYDLERQGIVFGQDEYYTLEQIRQVFKMTFGEDGTSLLVEKLRKELDL